MRVLVACEFSGTVRDAFTRAGHYAVSADPLPSETFGPHFQGDVRDILHRGWDLLVAHPPCTYLANSGVRWLREREGRWQDMEAACAFFCDLLNAPIPYRCIENPVPHRYARALIGSYTQTVQPWQFGHGEVKRTCFWLRNLPPLVPTNVVAGREARVHKMPPGPDRWKERSRFYRGIADAMASQWGAYVEQQRRAA